MPLGWGKILFERLFDWGYFTEEEEEFNNRKVECARGKVLGGSSSINAMAYVRCHREDYDRWSRNGCAGWSYADILPYFIKAEDWEKGDQPLRGTGGPLTTIENKFPDPLHEAWLKAGEQAGYTRTPDYNGAQNEGLGTLQSTIRNGKRCSAAVAYLYPAMKRPNLTVITKKLVHKVVLEGNKAVGVEYSAVNGGPLTSVRAEREVIVSGGVINSPQLLMLSGIGNADHLQEHGIDAAIDLKGVGQNLQDHLSVGVEYERIGDGPFVGTLRWDRLLLSMAQAYFLGTGFATEMPGPLTGYITTKEDLPQPDLQLLARFIPRSRNPGSPGTNRSQRRLHGAPRGAASEKPGRAETGIRQPGRSRADLSEILSEPEDWNLLREGIGIVKEIAGQRALDGFRGPEIQPAGESIDEFIKRTAWTVHHPLGTCKMGPNTDEWAVVDPEMRVHGAENLRVIDASIFPDMLGGNINAPTMAFADRAADLMMGNAPLAPMNIAA